MEASVRTNDMILLMDYYSVEGQDLETSLRLAGYDCPTMVIEDDGFLPDGVESVYGYFLGDFSKAKNVLGRPRYFNEIEVPDYWEISGNNTSGKVHDLYRERGRIFYAQPEHKRLVKVVDWLDERGIVRSSDHYNRFGALYARTIFNAQGKKVNKSYFSAEGKEMIVENFVTGDIVVNDGEKVKFFHTKTDFVVYFFRRAKLKQTRIFFNSLSTPFFVSEKLHSPTKRDVLFWQEPIWDSVPGNMQIILRGEATRTANIMVQKREAYDKLLALGANPDMVHRLGYIYPFQRENGHGLDALICTNSDNIAHCTKLVQELPQIHFHIAAITEMSSKLMAVGENDNVSLYPGVKMGVLDELFTQCDLYFDINHENEIVSAVRRAFMNNQLIFAFRETLHNGEYVAREHIYSESEPDRLIADVRKVMEDSKLIEEHLKLQREYAMAENEETYQNQVFARI